MLVSFRDKQFLLALAAISLLTYNFIVEYTEPNIIRFLKSLNTGKFVSSFC